jgi:YD repeat-containing protein
MNGMARSNGNVTAMSVLNSSGGTVVGATYTFDGSNRLLTQTTVGGTTTTYTYDANHNRKTLTTSASTKTYYYDSSDTELTSNVDPSGKATSYTYDATGNLTKATYDPTGADQVTGCHYDSSNRRVEGTRRVGRGEVTRRPGVASRRRCPAVVGAATGSGATTAGSVMVHA